jgi:hypothetical protein
MEAARSQVLGDFNATPTQALGVSPEMMADLIGHAAAKSRFLGAMTDLFDVGERA